MKRLLIVSIVTALTIVCLSACRSTASNTNSVSSGTNASNSKPAPTSNTTSAKKAEITTTAKALAKEYEADSKSSSKYDGKVVEISGKYEWSSGSIESPEVKFETGNSVHVTCKVSTSAIQAVAKFEKGQEIKMIGIGDPVSIIGPMFKDCEVAP